MITLDIITLQSKPGMSAKFIDIVHVHLTARGVSGNPLQVILVHVHISICFRWAEETSGSYVGQPYVYLFSMGMDQATAKHLHGYERRIYVRVSYICSLIFLVARDLHLLMNCRMEGSTMEGSTFISKWRDGSKVAA